MAVVRHILVADVVEELRQAVVEMVKVVGEEDWFHPMSITAHGGRFHLRLRTVTFETMLLILLNCLVERDGGRRKRVHITKSVQNTIFLMLVSISLYLYNRSGSSKGWFMLNVVVVVVVAAIFIIMAFASGSLKRGRRLQPR